MEKKIEYSVKPEKKKKRKKGKKKKKEEGRTDKAFKRKMRASDDFVT